MAPLQQAETRKEVFFFQKVSHFRCSFFLRNSRRLSEERKRLSLFPLFLFPFLRFICQSFPLSFGRRFPLAFLFSSFLLLFLFMWPTIVCGAIIFTNVELPCFLPRVAVYKWLFSGNRDKRYSKPALALRKTFLNPALLWDFLKACLLLNLLAVRSEFIQSCLIFAVMFTEDANKTAEGVFQFSEARWRTCLPCSCV